MSTIKNIIENEATGLMIKFENWDCFDGLSKNDVESIKADLVRLQENAINEFKKQINKINI